MRSLVILLCSCLLFLVFQRTSGQGLIGEELPCQAQGEDPDPNFPSDNLMCAANIPLRCFARSELCNGNSFCTNPTGSDEGLNNAALECDNGRYLCTPTILAGDSVTLDVLCDGTDDCATGEDETFELCANKCLLPYYGACTYTRVCENSLFGVNCMECISGFTVNPNNPNPVAPCLVVIELDQPQYIGFESTEMTEQICARLTIDLTQIVSLEDTFEDLFGSPTATISATITSIQTNDATGNVDFVISAQPVTLSATQLTDCVTVAIIDDFFQEGSEQFSVVLATSTPEATVINGNAPVTIIDNDNDVTPVYQQIQYFVNEDDVNFEICVAIVSPSANMLSVAGTVEVTFESGGSATANLDYIANANPSPTLNFLAGSIITNDPLTSTSACFTVPILDDNDLESLESFPLSLTNPTNLIVIDPGRATTDVNIIDDEIGAVIALDSSATGVEGSTVELCAEIISTTSNQPLNTPLTATVFTSPVSAIAILDYNPVPSPSTLVFPVGSTTGTEVCFDLALLTDNRIEDPETFDVTIIAVGNLLSIATGQDSAVVTILDQTVAEFALNMNAFSIDEDEGPQVVFAQIVNGVILDTSIDVVVWTLQSVPPSAIAGVDYTTTSVTLTFTNGNQGAMPVSIPIEDDVFVEGLETFEVELSIPLAFASRAVAVDPSLAVVTILDDDAIIFDVSATLASENDDFVIITVTPRAPIPGPVAVPVLVETVNGQALGGIGLDFTIVSETLTFAVGATASQFVSIPINDDEFVEGEETFEVDFSSTNNRVSFSPGSSIEIIIEDNDVLIYGYTSSFYQVDEDMGPLEAAVQLFPNSGIPIVSFTVFVSTDNGGAQAPGDFTALVNVPVTFPAFSDPGTERDVDVTIINDNLLEGTEQFTLLVTTPVVGAVAGRASAVGQIIDDEQPIVTLTPVFQFVDEEMNGVVQVCVEIVSQGMLPSAVAVTLNTDDGTATAPMDYTAIVNRVLVFPQGSVQGAEMCIDINVNNDNVLELTGENFFVNLETDDAQVATDTATIQFQETNDEVEFNFEMLTYSFPEEGGAQSVCIVASGAISEDVILTVVSNDISTEEGNDYTAASAMIEFPAGVTRRCVPLGILDDTIVEGDEQLTLTATILTPIPGASIGPIGTTTVTILDPVDRVTVSIGTPFPNVGEGDGTVRICVEIIAGSLAPGQTATVTFSTGSLSAIEDLDFEPEDVELTFNVLNMNQMLCVDIEIEDDLICEGPEIFSIGLTSTDPNVNLGTSSGTVTIIDNDVAEVALSVIEPDMFSGMLQECTNEQLVFEISAANGVQKANGRECTISIYTQDGSAEAGSDYIELVTTCTLSDTNSECEISIDIIDDFTEEADEAFFINLESDDPTRCNIDVDNITITIKDDEDCWNDVCDMMEICEELRCPNNFTCRRVDIGDDPHFAVSLSSGELLCYTVQGEHGFAFNLISNERLYMNAMFVPDAYREEVTWLGTMGIVVNNNGFKKSNMTKLRFVAIENEIHIDNQMVLQARNIEKITLENGKLTVSEAPPIDGYKTPFVRVNLNDVDLSFSVKFMTEHLDLYWHSTGQKTTDSHGLIGQFFNEGVVLDDVRKILILPGKEPVPIQRKPLWAFMERETGDSTNFCWVAMNPGYQGDGLIDGTYFDYLVDDVLSTEFKFKKL